MHVSPDTRGFRTGERSETNYPLLHHAIDEGKLGYAARLVYGKLQEAGTESHVWRIQSPLSLVVEADLKSLVHGAATLAMLIHAPDQSPSDQGT